jgi:hypothetical protein
MSKLRFAMSRRPLSRNSSALGPFGESAEEALLLALLTRMLAGV